MKMVTQVGSMSCFWDGPFSNWWIAPIQVRGFTFNCCEQYFMVAKASMCGDKEIAQQIVVEKDPREQKKLGRHVNGFDPIAWDAVSRDVMFRANWAKYTQHPILKLHLLDTGSSTIVEASPYDCLWGVGLAADDPLIQDPKNWRGNNWLGQILMDIRGSLK